MKSLLTETAGTFFLILAIGLSVRLEPNVASIAIGFTVTVLVYAGFRMSGAHYNPAVSLAAAIRGVFPANKLIGYWCAQLIGGVAAAFLVHTCTGGTLTVTPAGDTSALTAIAGETVGTFVLVLVILHVAASETTRGNTYFGLAIGTTVMALSIAFGSITGGAFNPAVGFAPAIVNAVLGNGFGDLTWVYAAGPFGGAAAAAFVSGLNSPAQRPPRTSAHSHRDP